MKVEWWYNDAVFHHSDGTELALARLTVRDDGTAQVLTDGGERIELENELDATIWLVDEEYRRLADLIEDRQEEGLPADPRLAAPPAGSDEELVGKMVIRLAPAGRSQAG